jgi:[FeFe] hydrogenase H-cluster maturation GTPase HydF
MEKTPKGLRIHISFFGRRNVGKSSLINKIVGQEVSIVSPILGTTTDPVEKTVELLPLGPVVLIDTAGIDDEGDVGDLRVAATKKVMGRTDIAVIVTDADQPSSFELELVGNLKKSSIPFIIVRNKADLNGESDLTAFKKINKRTVLCSSLTGDGLTSLKAEIIALTPNDYFSSASLLGDLIKPGSLVVLVVPIDLEAPKGRLIMPQVQSIRDILDNDSYCIVAKEKELRDVLNRLKADPDLVITDSQAFLRVAADIPTGVRLTSFSILFARFKGDLSAFVNGVKAVDSLKSGDKILITEACAHHAIGDDIGKVKIPRWLTQYTGCKLQFEHTHGHDFPSQESLKEYSLVIHCGACTFNKRNMLTRILKCREAGVPITNYGICISYSLGIFKKALEPFALDN